ncbi:MAG: hypothetical protein M1839_008119 [Geoglossum umbratile]|nr:MAG: hypothetical protein M1839_008119 [Geoglossum umbratile]
MFSLPDSKRVRREELYSTGSSDAEDSVVDYREIEGLLKAKFEGSCDGEDHSVSRGNGASGLGDRVGEEEFEFRLFSSTGASNSKASSRPSVHKVVLRSPSPVNTEPGFVTKRPESYYFARTAERGEEFKSIVVEGTELLNRAAPGCALPWRVTIIKMARLLKDHRPIQGADATSTPRRKRPGKKRRILLRKKTAAKVEHKERAAREKAEKEEAEKEKRTRRNREKKIKKRLRDKLKKTGETVAGGITDSVKGSREATSDIHELERASPC